MRTKLNYAKQKNNKLRKWLAHKLRKEKQKKTILKIEKRDKILLDYASIKKSCYDFCSKLYKREDTYHKNVTYPNSHKPRDKLWISYNYYKDKEKL